MGFLKKLFGGGGAATFDDRIWMRSDLRREDAIARIVGDAREGLLGCLAVYHFPATGEELRARLASEGLTVEEPGSPDASRVESLVAGLGAGRVGMLHSAGLSQEIKLGKAERSAAGGRSCNVHLVEHYPMLYRDSHVLNLVSVLPVGSAFHGYLALDEPWIDASVGDQGRLMELLHKLGLDPSERLDNPMVSSALARAQERIGQRLRKSEQHADSLEEWTRLNLGG
jgi:hypothetical protein